MDMSSMSACSCMNRVPTHRAGKAMFQDDGRVFERGAALSARPVLLLPRNWENMEREFEKGRTIAPLHIICVELDGPELSPLVRRRYAARPPAGMAAPPATAAEGKGFESHLNAPNDQNALDVEVRVCRPTRPGSLPSSGSFMGVAGCLGVVGRQARFIGPHLPPTLRGLFSCGRRNAEGLEAIAWGLGGPQRVRPWRRRRQFQKSWDEWKAWANLEERS